MLPKGLRSPAFAAAAQETDKGAREVFIDALAHGDVSRAIEQQEARGQQDLVNSSTLPAKGVRDLEQFGVIIGEPVKGDPLFVNVTLPEGWRKEPTDHSMWSNLVDADGVIRAKIFFKAAFYDRDAFLHLA